ncbi:MAG: 2-dehydropantoate 2-reductase [Actinomycetota bacterium]|nr:2-dehydropantoate 2-reductase [Actinomycetota bacterium]
MISKNLRELGSLRIAVLGAGSLGTVVGALLSKNNLDVTMIDANEKNVSALNEKGARVTGHLELVQKVRAVLPEGVEGFFDLVIYLVKATFDDIALSEISRHMTSDSALITLQNGVPEERVARIIGKERTLGGSVGWGATWLEPGVSRLTSDPDDMTYEIGEVDGEITDRIEMVKEVLDKAGKASISTNLLGVRWTKLLVNVATSGLSTVLGCAYGDIIDDEKAILAAMAIMFETILTAKALGIKMEPMKGVDPAVVLQIAKENLENAKNVVKIVYEPHRDIKASMLQDIEKGIPCEVDSLNGYLSRKSKEAEVKTPVNDRVTDLIKEIEKGNLKPSFENISLIEVPGMEYYVGD